jgi:hypothetical protein
VLGGEGAGRRKPAKARCGKAAARAQCSEDALAARARRRYDARTAEPRVGPPGITARSRAALLGSGLRVCMRAPCEHNQTARGQSAGGRRAETRALRAAPASESFESRMRAHFLRGVTFTQSVVPSGSGIQHTVHHASCRVAVPLLPVRPGILNSAAMGYVLRLWEASALADDLHECGVSLFVQLHEPF